MGQLMTVSWWKIQFSPKRWQILTKPELSKIGPVQFCLFTPKTDMDNQIVVSDMSRWTKCQERR